METVTHCRAMLAFCRQRALMDGEDERFGSPKLNVAEAHDTRRSGGNAGNDENDFLGLTAGQSVRSAGSACHSSKHTRNFNPRANRQLLRLAGAARMNRSGTRFHDRKLHSRHRSNTLHPGRGWRRCAR